MAQIADEFSLDLLWYLVVKISVPHVGLLLDDSSAIERKLFL